MIAGFRITGEVTREQLTAILDAGVPLTVEAISHHDWAGQVQSSTSSPSGPTLAATTSALKKLRHGRDGNPGCKRESWAIIRGAAEHFTPGEEFTLADLAGKIGETYEKVFARYRTLGRPQKALKLEIFRPVSGTSKPKRYTLDAVTHRAIMEA